MKVEEDHQHIKGIIFIILSFVFSYVLLTSLAYADGIHISDSELHLYEPLQKAVVSWDGKTETMILSSAVQSNEIANFAWLVPIQSSSKPTVTAGNISIFEDLVNYFTPPSDQGTLGKGVNVIETKEIGIYDITILNGTSSAEIVKWLNENSYQVPDEAKPILDKYIAKGNFYLVVNKIDLRNKYDNEISFINSIESGKYANYTFLNGMFFNQLVEALASGADSGSNVDKLAVYIYGALSSSTIYYPHQYLNDYDFVQYHGNEYFFLNKSYIFDFFSKNLEFIVQSSNLSSVPGWSWTDATYSFFENNTANAINNSPGIYCNVGDPGGDVALIYSNPAITKSAVSLGSCYYFNDQNKKLMQEEIPKYFQSYMKIRDEINKSWNDFELLAKSHNADLGKMKELKATLDDLKIGMGTPLQLQFQPIQPYYPLEISSLSNGGGRIEVYVLTDTPVVDKNNILIANENKTVSPDLAKNLNLGNAKFVTRLSFYGNLNNLTSDAQFEKSGNYVIGIDFLKNFWNWITSLFTRK
jgi:hypothetical protein